jgi:hypothetical protein
VLQDVDSSYFDLQDIRKAVYAALKAATTSVVGLAISHPEAQFEAKLQRWLEFETPAQPITDLSLSPVIAELPDHLADVHAHRTDLETATNLLLKVLVSGVDAEIIEGFWSAVSGEFGAGPGKLVLLFVGNQATRFPAGVKVIPEVRFDPYDVRDWTGRVVWGRGWPPDVARTWSDWLCAEATRNGELSVRQLYRHLDESLAIFRSVPDSEPDRFRALYQRS